MKILATADLHIGAGGSLRTDHLADQEAVLAQIVAVAREEEVDLVAIAGDVFHRPQPAPPVLHVFKRFTRELARYGIPAVACSGNVGHDLVNGDVESALELFESEWFRVSRVPELVKAAEDVAVCTLPSVPVHRLVARHNGGDRAEIFREATDLLLRVGRELREQVPDGWPSLLLSHWSVSGASLPTGLSSDDLNEPVLPWDAIVELGFDAAIFGHLHMHQVLNEEPLVAYAGPPMLVDFGEQNVPHGCVLLELEGGEVTHQFIPLDDRPFFTVDVDLTDPNRPDGDDETDVIAGAITLPIEGAVVRLRYRATEEQHRRVDRQALLGFLAEAGADKVHGPTWEPVRTTRARAEVNGDGLSDHDALSLWCEAHELEEPRRVSVHSLLERLEVPA
jgi:exonuclease SbcD